MLTRHSEPKGFKKKLLQGVALIAAMITAVIYGAAIGRYMIFPYDLVVKAKRTILPSLQNDPSQNKFYAQTSLLYEALPNRTVDVVMMGDSLTQGCPWNEMLPGRSVLNRGIATDVTAGMLLRLPEILAHHGEVFVLAGLNDIRGGQSPEATAMATEKIIVSLSAGGKAPILQSVVLTNAAMLGPESDRLNTKIRELNTLLKEVATRRGIQFLDINKALSEHDQLRPDFTVDGVHIIGLGCLAWAGVVQSFLDNRQDELQVRGSAQ